MNASKYSLPTTYRGALIIAACWLAGATVGYGLLYARLGDWRLLILLAITGVNSLVLLLMVVGETSSGRGNLLGGVFARPAWKMGKEGQTKALRVSVDIAHLSAALDDPDLLADALADTLRTRLDLSAVHLYLVDPGREQGEASLRSTAASDVAALASVPYSALPGDDTPVGQALERGEPVASHDLSTPVREGAKVAVPLIIEGRVLGALILQAEGRPRFEAHEIETFVPLADHVALALGMGQQFLPGQGAESPHLAEEGQPSGTRALVVDDMASGLQEAASVDDVLLAAAQTLREALGGYRVRLRLSPEALAEQTSDEDLPDAGPKPNEDGGTHE
jgi:hypothetical protein